jgi:hypothetical protein
MNRIKAYAWCRWLSLWISVLLLISGAQITSAHEMNPAIIDAQLLPDNRIELTLRLNIEARLAEISPIHSDTEESANAALYDRFRALPPAQLSTQAQPWLKELPSLIKLLAQPPIKLEFTSLTTPEVGNLLESRDSQVRLITTEPVTQNWSFAWDQSLGAAAFRFSTVDAQDVSTAYLEDGANSDTVDMTSLIAKPAMSVLVDYIGVGFEHIIPLGWDHILFVVGLFLFSIKLRSLIWQVSAFTLAHTITLALGMLGYVALPSYIVEPLIAATIVYVAVENIVFKQMTWWRPLLVFCFGLLHGLGFASVLTDFGLSSQSFVAGLIGFNIGVELGQLAVILICFALFGVWFRYKSWYRSMIVVNGSAAIGLIGAYWFVERVFF